MSRVRELTVQYRIHPSGAIMDARNCSDSRIAYSILRPMLEDQAVEVFVAVHLDARLRLLGVQEIGRGGIDSCPVAIRMIYAAALGTRNSSSLILAHNHPSGDPTPSPEDIQLTKQIAQAGRLFGIAVLDHLIIGDQTFVSLKDTGRM